jgi:hypothetical protein
VVFENHFSPWEKPMGHLSVFFTAPSLSSCLDELQASVQTTQTFQRCSESLRLGCEARLLERGQLGSSMESSCEVVKNEKSVLITISYHFMSFPLSISSTL